MVAFIGPGKFTLQGKFTLARKILTSLGELLFPLVLFTSLDQRSLCFIPRELLSSKCHIVKAMASSVVNYLSRELADQKVTEYKKAALANHAKFSGPGEKTLILRIRLVLQDYALAKEKDEKKGKGPSLIHRSFLEKACFFEYFYFRAKMPSEFDYSQGINLANEKKSLCSQMQDKFTETFYSGAPSLGE